MAAATGIIGGASAIGKFFQGRGMEKRGQKGIDNFEWNELKNVADDLSVSTLGADLRKEELSRSTATAIDALSKGGARALGAGIGAVQQNNTTVAKEIGANLDEQQKTIDMVRAQDAAKIRGMKEKRQSDELQGYGNMMNTGMGMKYGGLTDALNTAGFISQSDFGKQIDGGISSLFGGGDST